MSEIPLLPFPPRHIRAKLGAEDWDACVQGWLVLLRRYLYLSDAEYRRRVSDHGALSVFLVSYVRENTRDRARQQTEDTQLRGLCFRLLHRALLTPKVASSLLAYDFLSGAALVYSRSGLLKDCLEKSWQLHKLDEAADFVELRRQLQPTVSDQSAKYADQAFLTPCAALLHVCPSYGKFLLSGSDFVDWLVSSWSTSPPENKNRLVHVAFLALKDLLDGASPNVSSLLDHFYDLKARAEKDGKSNDYLFLRHLVSATSMIGALQKLTPASAKTRAKPILSYLDSIKDVDLVRKRQVKKGKKAERSQFAGHATEEMHVHRLSSISQIQELFPDLGAGFIAKLLDEYHEDVEQVTAHLLEGTLPPHLAGADRSERLSTESAGEKQHYDLEPRSTPPLAPRANIHDEDDFDRLAISAERLHIGKKERKDSVSDLDKARIYSSLAAFDPDDDERDDTYDVQDVGGTIDVQGYDKDRDDAKQEQHTESLYRAYKLDESTFGRDKAARQSSARQALRSETGMTDEVIEGWALMLQRNPRRLKTLEAKFTDFKGEQEQLHSSRWRAADDSSEGEQSGGGGRGGIRGRGRGRGRGGGRGRGRGSGNVAGPANERDTQIARQRKDENKASRANHNRRAGRAKKLAKVGLPG